MAAPGRLRPGLCSVTLRAEAPSEVIEVARRGGLTCIEWGGDVHVPAGDVAAATHVRELTRAAGLDIASYGSYFRAGPDEAGAFAPVLRSAVALGVSRVRIWAGASGSRDTSTSERARVVEAVQEAADLAASEGVELAFEYHGGTLADTPSSTLRLLREVDRHNVTTYWQPAIGAPDDGALDELDAVAEHVSAIHVFSWWPGTTRRRLESREVLWRAVLDRVAEFGRPVDALLEFVPDDDPEEVVAAATTLRSWREHR